MKRILALRHGKAAAREQSLRDVDRPLAEEGRQEARELGALLARRYVRPDRIVCSAAPRALETASLVAAELGGGIVAVPLEDLYSAGARGYLGTLAEQPDVAGCVMIVGHNPAMEELAGMLVGYRVELGTCWLADMRAPIETWAELEAKGRCSLDAVLTPRGEMREGAVP